MMCSCFCDTVFSAGNRWSRDGAQGTLRMAHPSLSAPGEGGPAPLQREMGAELVPAAEQMLLEPSGKW